MPVLWDSGGPLATRRPGAGEPPYIDSRCMPVRSCAVGGRGGSQAHAPPSCQWQYSASTDLRLPSSCRSRRRRWPAASMAPSESATSESGQRAAGRDSEAELARFCLGIYAAKSAAAAPPPSCLVTLIIGLRFLAECAHE